MRIAIDLRMVGRVPHGIARYAQALWAGLPGRGDRRYLALVGPDTPEPPLPRPGDAVVRTRARFLSPLEQIELPLVLRRADVDLLHATSFSVPAAWRGPLVLTLHDVTHLEAPELRTPARLAYYRGVVGPAARRARRVLTVSQYSREAIAEALEVPRSQIAVAPNAAPETPAAARQQQSPPRLLAVGTGKAHKNLALLRRMLPLLPSPAALTLVGRDLDAFSGPGITLAGAVDDARLGELYRQATLFLCPSRCEGFGLPALEAALAGAPVLAAQAGALPEIWSGAAELLPPNDPQAWANAVARLLADPQERQHLAERCAKRALGFTSWQPAIDIASAAYA